MDYFLDIVAILVAAFFAYKMKDEFGKSTKPLYFILFSVFYIFPIVLDRTIGFPEYDYYYGFEIACKDTVIRSLYDIILIFFSFVYYNFKRRSVIRPIMNFSSTIKNTNNWFFLGMLISPLIAIFVMRNTMVLYLLQWRELGLVFLEKLPYYSIAEKFSYVGICCSILIFLANKDTLRFPILYRVLSVLLLYINICIEGKRAAIFFSIVVIILTLFVKVTNLNYNSKNKSKENNLNLLKLSLLFTIVLIAVSIMMSISSDVHVDRGSSTSFYTMSRIDFLRDDRVRVVINDELNGGNMLDYPGQTIISKGKYIIPINFILEKYNLYGDPLLYQHYFSATLNNTKPSEDLSYMTVSIFAELLSNFGLILGTVLFIAFCIFMYRVTDKYPYPMNLLIVASFVMLNMFDCSYCMPLIEVAFIICIIYQRMCASTNKAYLKRSK